MNDKKHRHNFNRITEWVRAPIHRDDHSRYWVFTVKVACDCGKEKEREALDSEVRDKIELMTCSSCGTFGEVHSTGSDCVRALALKVQFLEERLEKMAAALRGAL